MRISTVQEPVLPQVIFKNVQNIGHQLDGTFKEITEKDRHQLSESDSTEYNKEFQEFKNNDNNKECNKSDGQKLDIIG